MPEDIFRVDELPKTRSGKVLRRVIRATYLGEPLGDVSSMENPGSVAGLPTKQHDSG